MWKSSWRILARADDSALERILARLRNEGCDVIAMSLQRHTAGSFEMLAVLEHVTDAPGVAGLLAEEDTVLAATRESDFDPEPSAVIQARSSKWRVA